MNDTDLVLLQRTLYDSSNATRRWLHRARRDWISAAIRRYGRPGMCALEIGPGSGVYVPVLKELCSQLYLADCEPAYLAAIEQCHADDQNMKFVIDDITRSRLPEDCFDLVLCTEVLEHIPDSLSALCNLRRVLKAGGVLILSTPQRYSSLEVTARLALSPRLIWLTRLIYGEPVLPTGHINLMTQSAVLSQIEAAGLHVVASHKGGLYLPGVAELCGALGQRVAAGLENYIRDSRLDAVLWTQYYVAVR